MTVVEHRSDLLDQRGVSDLVEELRGVLRKGLPVEPGIVWPQLTTLSSVTALAPHDTSLVSRTEALEQVLGRAFTLLEPAGFRTAAAALFGLPPGEAGSTLTRRREVAARALDREVHHFRKRMEPQILVAVARALHRDAAVRPKPWAHPPPVRPGSRRRYLPPDVFAWEAAEHEEALTRMWACVYATRAELLAVERQASMGDTDRVAAAAEAALWRYGQMQAQARHYRAAYGATLLPDSSGAPHDLAALAGFTPTLSSREISLVADASTATGPRLFISAVRAAPGGDGLLTSWRDQLTDLEETDP